MAASAPPQNLINLQVIEARDLLAMDTNGFSDPYCIISCGRKKMKTRVIKETLAPMWNETFELDIHKQVELTIQVWDRDLLKKDDFIGEVILEVASLPIGAAEMWLKLQQRRGKTEIEVIERGELCVRFLSGNDQTIKKPAVFSGGTDQLPSDLMEVLKLKVENPEPSEEDTQADLSSLSLNRIPKFVLHHTLWTNLNLSFNQFPQCPDVGVFANLLVLNLSANQLTSLHYSIWTLEMLQELRLFGNDLSLIPASVGQLTDLRILDISNNRVNNLPPDIGKLALLEELLCTGNALSTLPAQMNSCFALEVADFSCNQLSVLPDSVFNGHTRLMDLNLATNGLKALPIGIGKATRLVELNVSDNPLSDLPVTIGKVQGLRNIYLERCPIANAEMLKQYRIGIHALQDYLEVRLQEHINNTGIIAGFDDDDDEDDETARSRKKHGYRPEFVSALTEEDKAKVGPVATQQDAATQKKIEALKKMATQMLFEVRKVTRAITEANAGARSVVELQALETRIETLKVVAANFELEMANAARCVPVAQHPRLVPPYDTDDDVTRIRKANVSVISKVELSLSGVQRYMTAGAVDLVQFAALLKMVREFKVQLTGSVK